MTESSLDADAPINRCGPLIHATCFRDREALVRNAADLLEETIRAASGSKHPSGLLLAGGSTPFPAYAEVAKRRPAADGITVMFTDERYVPSDDEASNYHQAKELIHGLHLLPGQVLRVETERTLDEAADASDRALRAFLEADGTIPLGLLGLGADGHTASLFSDDHLRAAKGRYAIAVDRPDGRSAVTVTPDLLARTERLVFLVSGPSKREVLGRLINDAVSVTAGRAVAGHPRVEVWCEPEAWPR